MTNCLGKSWLFISFTVRFFRKRLSLSIYRGCPSFPFGFEGRMLDVIV